MSDKTPSALDQLDERERRFCEGIAAGMTGVEGAKYAGCDATSRSGLADFARRLRKKPHIQVAIEELREQHRLELESLWDETVRVLREVLKDKSSPNARVRAAELLAKLLGKLQPERHEHAHVHAHFEVPDLAEPQARAELVRLVRIALQALPAGERAALVREALGPEREGYRLPAETSA
jgi:phage terminase small subunit